MHVSGDEDEGVVEHWEGEDPMEEKVLDEVEEGDEDGEEMGVVRFEGMMELVGVRQDATYGAAV